MTFTVKDETRAILAHAENTDDLGSLVTYTGLYGYDVMKGWLDHNDNHWSSEKFDEQLIGKFEGTQDFFIEYVIPETGSHLAWSVECYLGEMLNFEKLTELLLDGTFNDVSYFGIATGFCEGLFFQKVI